MTSRDLVRQTLAFQSPARVPRQLWLLPWAQERHPAETAAIQERFPDDIVHSPCFYRTDLPVEGDRYTPGTYCDEWGCVFENIHGGAIGQVKAPLLTDWSRVDDVHIPVERLTLDRERVDAFCRGTDCFVLAGVTPRPFEQLQFIRGTENLFFDLMDRPPELFVLLERMQELYVKELELWAETDVDALNFMDDWGTQEALLIAPELFREIFKPLYRQYAEIAHGKSKHLFMHTDGYILDILPDLIEVGVDAINCQVPCMGAKILGERFRGRITFWGEADRQRLLPRGTRDEVFAAVREMRDALFDRGGVIAQCEFGLAAKPENVMAFFEAWDGAVV
jgi:hypothetical protein